MSKVVVGMTMSVDGFVADSSGNLEVLYPDFETFRESDLLKESIQNTGAVVMGRKAYAMADPDSYAHDFEFQVPIFVLTHSIPDKKPKENDHLSITFVTDGIESAIQQAKATAGGKDVTVVGGASTIRQILQAGLADELDVDVMPILLCSGLRFFEGYGIAPVQLERLDMHVLPNGRTTLRFRVVK